MDVWHTIAIFKIHIPVWYLITLGAVRWHYVLCNHTLTGFQHVCLFLYGKAKFCIKFFASNTPSSSVIFEFQHHSLDSEISMLLQFWIRIPNDIALSVVDSFFKQSNFQFKIVVTQIRPAYLPSCCALLPWMTIGYKKHNHDVLKTQKMKNSSISINT